jgi:2-hydroxy-4-(methylsulfanyl)butanoate S-methyltransferase
MNNPAETWNMGRLMELATGYWKSAVLSAGVELGLFDHLSNGPATAATLAGQTGTEQRYLEEVLDALTALELLKKSADSYAIAPGADALLNRHSPTCTIDALRYNMDLYPLWGRIPDAVRAGQPALPPGAHLGSDPARTRRFAMGMHSRALGMAPALLPALDPRGARRLLDVAAGPGTFSRLLAEQHPELHVTQFELPAVQEVARELTQDSLAADRISFQPGDYHHDPLPQGCDLALLCGAVHQEDEADARQLFEKIRAALTPGGRFLVVDMMLEPARTGPLFSNLFSINMMLTSPKGRVFTAQTLERLLRQAGFETVTTVRPSWSPYWILEAV